MKKQIAIIGIIALLVSGGLSGCTERLSDTKSGNADKIELVSYSVETEFHGMEKAKDFVNNQNATRYIVNGTLKNIANEDLTNICIIAYFYDNDNFVNSETDFTNNLAANQTWDFLIVYSYGRDENLVYADKVEFEIIINDTIEKDTNMNLIQPTEVKLIGDVEKIGIVNCSIESQRYDYSLGRYVKITDGFKFSEDVSRYLIITTFKNIAGKRLYKIIINYKFYNNTNQVVDSGTIDKTNIAATQIWTFDFICTGGWSRDLHINYVEFEITAISPPL